MLSFTSERKDYWVQNETQEIKANETIKHSKAPRPGPPTGYKLAPL